MFNDLKDILRELAQKMVASRLFMLALVFTAMFGILIVKLFNLQIVAGEKYMEDYVRLTQKEVSIPVPAAIFMIITVICWLTMSQPTQ